jgi:hypothetical protein
MRRPIRRILTPQERAQLQARIQDNEIQLNAPEMTIVNGREAWVPSSRVEQQHRDLTESSMARMKRMLEAGSAHDLTDREIVERDNRIKELEESLRKKMVPKAFYHQKQDDVNDFHKTVDHLVKTEFSQEFQTEAQELKNLRRERDPDNPNAGNIENLRQ